MIIIRSYYIIIIIIMILCYYYIIIILLYSYRTIYEYVLTICLFLNNVLLKPNCSVLAFVPKKKKFNQEKYVTELRHHWSDSWTRRTDEFGISES